MGIDPEISVEMTDKKYGDNNESLEILEKGKVLEMHNIDEIDPRVKDHHANEVDLALLQLHGIEDRKDTKANANTKTELLEIASKEDDTQRTLKAIFKPFDGENQSIRRNLAIDAFYKREKAAYLMDQFLGFNLVPPTIIREIPEEGIGSLQLYIDKEIATPRGVYLGIEDENESEKYLNMENSNDWIKMAVFDWVIGNFDRNPWNILQYHENSKNLAVIDHGNAWCDYPTRKPEKGKEFGPRYLLKSKVEKFGDQERETAVDFPVPEEVLNKVAKLKENKEAINDQLRDLVTNKSEIEMMWERIDELLEKRIIL